MTSGEVTKGYVILTSTRQGDWSGNVYDEGDGLCRKEKGGLEESGLITDGSEVLPNLSTGRYLLLRKTEGREDLSRQSHKQNKK